MDTTRYYQQQQEAKRLQNRISSFLEDFRVGTLLSGSGIRKLRGAKPLAVFTAMFTMPFIEVDKKPPLSFPDSDYRGEKRKTITNR